MHVTVIHSPSAGDEALSAEHLCARFGAAGHQVVYRSTHEEGWDEVLDLPADVTIAAGGDGTIHQVFTRLVGRTGKVGLIPLGTANNIARTLGIPVSDPQAGVAAWVAGAYAGVQPFDVPLLTGARGASRFVESAGGGLFAEVLTIGEYEEARNRIDGVGDGLRLLGDLVRDARVQPWGIELDGEDLSGEYLAVEAMNVREVGPHVCLAPGADPGDGQLDLVLVAREHRGAVAGQVASQLARTVHAGCADGDRGPTPYPVLRGRRLVVRPPDGARLHLDDDHWTHEAGRDGTELVVTVDGTRLDLLRVVA